MGAVVRSPGGPTRRGVIATTGGAQEAGRRRNRFSVRTRLLAAIIVPIAVMSLGAAQNISARHADVNRAEQVVAGLDRLFLLAELRSALFAEWLAAEILVPARNPAPEILALSGFGRTLLDDPQRIPERTDAALAAVAPGDRPFAQAELDRVRAEQATWASTIAGISASLGPFYERTEAAMLRLATPVRVSIVLIADPPLVAAGTTFERAIELPGTAAELLRAVTDLFIAEPARRPGLQSEAAAASARFDAVAGRYVRSFSAPGSDASTIGLIEPIVPDDLAAVIDDARAGALTDPSRSPTKPDTVGMGLLTGVDWLLAIDEIPARTAVHARDVAHNVLQDERAAERQWLAVIGSVIAASLLVVVALARSIARPVERLTEHARQLGAGNLAVEPLPTTGPPDVAVAAAAINDVVGALNLIRAKAAALTEGRLSDPALAEPLSGPLGAELERTTNEFITTLIERQSFAAQLDHETTHDTLTGLVNRSAVLAALHDAGPGDPYRSGAVVHIDLDDFKRVNDVHGHGGGDQLLQVVASRIAAFASPGDLVSRWAGDEFVVVLGNRTPAEAQALAATIVDSVGRPALVDGAVTRVSACAGVACAVHVTGSGSGWADDLLRQADLASYHAKRSGAGSVVMFDEQLSDKVRAQKEIEQALAEALDPSAGQLFLVYQPIVDSRTSRMRSVETLVRWNHPGRGPMRPDEFIPVAERSHLIVQLDMWVIDTALRQYARWSADLNVGPMTISVNLSARTLRAPDLVDRVMAALEAAGVMPHRLMLEVTETTLITDVQQAVSVLRQLRERGVSIAIDDFGTGFTSINQLRTLPVDELKIDQSFVAALPGAEGQVLVRMINDLAHHLGILTVAEGVETANQRDVLIELGCDAMQGYLFSPPIQPDTLAAFVATRDAPHLA